jgi:hypothetical protein
MLTPVSMDGWPNVAEYGPHHTVVWLKTRFGDIVATQFSTVLTLF